MGELHIRINKRLLERAFWVLAVLILAVLLYSKWDVSPSVDDAQVSLLQQEVIVLEAQNENLTSQLKELEAPPLEEVKPDPEPEVVKPENDQEELSGELDISWDVDTDANKLDSVLVTVLNGMKSTQAIELRLYYDNFEEDILYHKEELVIKSGEEESIYLMKDRQGKLPSTIPEDVDTLVLDIKDSDGDLIDRFEQDVN